MISVFAQLLNKKVISAEQIIVGRNSQVYKLVCDNNENYCAKVYFEHALDKKDRLGVEFSSLDFMWSNGIKCIPQPLFIDRANRFAVYEFIDGNRISSQDVLASDVDYASEFIIKINQLGSSSQALSLPPAAEACFSIEAIVDSIQKRLDRLSSVDNYGEFQSFLTQELIPYFNRLVERVKSLTSSREISYSSDLTLDKRILSPSDFGFHNALRLSNGSIKFLDFEYFGWDDPAKLVCDFLLHPGMDLDKSLRDRFAENIFNGLKHGDDIRARVDMVFSLWGVKWCTILLNEFVPEHYSRRNFAYNSTVSKEDLQRQSLEKSIRMLAKIS